MKALIDPTKMADWQIAEEAEKGMKTIYDLTEDLQLSEEEFMPYGHYVGKLNFIKIMERLQDKPNGKYINVTAITPTPFGEGKSTTTIGLIEGLGLLNKKVTGAIRQPSSRPTFNIKGSAAGGGLAQCIPLSDFSLGLTGDIDAVTNAHNLAMVALTSRMLHENNYNDEQLAKKGLKRLDIDPKNVQIKWAMDFCAQQMRNIVTGLGEKKDGVPMESGFQISVSSELMAILAVATDFKDLRKRISKMVLAYSKNGDPVTTADLEVDGAITALLSKAIYPNLIQTIEGQPILVHAGPFANIALGQSSIIADKLGLKLADYHITESGFGADIGYEKFWNIKNRFSGLKPDCAVLVVTVRALKLQGGGPAAAPGKKLDAAYIENHPELVKKGLDNMLAHIDIIKKSGVPVVVCLNHFHTDHDEEVEIIKKAARSAGVRVAVSKHWALGGIGAIELAGAVIDACEEPNNFKFLYQEEESIISKIEKIAGEIYGADGVAFSAEALSILKMVMADLELSKLSICMAKTHLSISDDPKLKNKPVGWKLFIRDLLIYKGAGFIVPVAGEITLMPGTASDANFRRIDVDVDRWKVTGMM